MKKEKVTFTDPDYDGILCICGNTPNGNGFYPCDERGREIEPLAGVWKDLYACDRCGRMINSELMEVVGNIQESLKKV